MVAPVASQRIQRSPGRKIVSPSENWYEDNGQHTEHGKLNGDERRDGIATFNRKDEAVKFI